MVNQLTGWKPLVRVKAHLDPGELFLLLIVRMKRPVWIGIWGGANTLAQALFDVRNTRTTEEVQEFVSKIKVYSISDQDEMRVLGFGKSFRNCFTSCAQAPHIGLNTTKPLGSGFQETDKTK